MKVTISKIPNTGFQLLINGAHVAYVLDTLIADWILVFPKSWGLVSKATVHECGPSAIKNALYWCSYGIPESEAIIIAHSWAMSSDDVFETTIEGVAA